MARRENWSVGELIMVGAVQKVGTYPVRVLARDRLGKVLLCIGDNTPANGDAGFARGCIFIKSSNGAVYFNSGTSGSASFDLQGVVSPGSITATELDSSILPSHVVKFAGLSTAENDDDAQVVISQAGVLATDIAICTLYSATNDVYVKKAVCSANTITVTLSGNGGASTRVAYQVLRAVA